MADPNANPSTDKRKNHGPTVHALKRAKFEAKQERRRQQALQIHQHPQYASWFNGREDYAAFITAEDVHAIRKLRDGTNNDTTTSYSISARLKRIAFWIEPFFDLKEMPSNNTRDGEERLFISEGTEAVRMMIQRCDKNVPTQPTSDDGTTITAASIGDDNDSTETTTSPPPVRLVSILSKPATFFDAPTQLLKDIEKRHFTNPVSEEGTKSDNDKVVPPFKIIIANEEALSEIAGFPIARGALACGIVPSYMQNHAFEWLTNLLSSETSSSTTTNPTDSTTQQQEQKKPITKRRKLLALDRIANAANMGSILRTAAAFSIDAIILSDDSCDAWYRQSVRVSLGHVVTVPIIRVSDWKRGYEKDMKNTKDNETSSINDANNGGLGRVLTWLREEMNVESLAAVVDDESDKGYPPLVTLESHQLCHDHSWICVLGNEGHGISDEVIRKCDKRITIQSSEFVDSLSLPVAAGILMHGLVNANI